LRLAGQLTQSESDSRSAADKWSPGEILDHLILSEGVYRKVFRELIDLDATGKRPVVYRGFTEMDTSIFGIPSEFLPLLSVPFAMFNLFVPAAVRETFMKYRIARTKNPKVATPAGRRPVAELVVGLEASLAETTALFEAYPGASYARMRFSHPLLGINDMGQLFRLLSLHEQRHQAQFRETVAAIRSQGTGTADLAPSSTR
jgi:hypothetical protein